VAVSIRLRLLVERPFVVLLTLALASAFSCAPDDDVPLRFGNGEGTNFPCIPGEQRQCACPDGTSGVQVCDRDGGQLLPCECSGQTGSCTVYPDCRGCTRCFDTCICHSQGDVDGCLRTCGLGDAGSDAAPDAGGECVPAGCPVPPSGVGTGCCTEGEKCGLVVSIIGPECVELNQPGKLDSQCPTLDFPTFSLPGCCRPDGRCGVLERFLPLGCIARDAIFPDAGQSCTSNEPH
jgi:hypothetical protein